MELNAKPIETTTRDGLIWMIDCKTEIALWKVLRRLLIVQQNDTDLVALFEK